MTFKEYIDSKYLFDNYMNGQRKLDIIADAFIDWIDLTYGEKK